MYDILRCTIQQYTEVLRNNSLLSARLYAAFVIAGVQSVKVSPICVGLLFRRYFSRCALGRAANTILLSKARARARPTDFIERLCAHVNCIHQLSERSLYVCEHTLASVCKDGFLLLLHRFARLVL